PLTIAVPLATVLLVAWAVVMTRPTHVLVDADGILVSWLWQKRFIPYDDLKEARPTSVGGAGGLELELSVAPSASLRPERGLPAGVVDRIHKAKTSADLMVELFGDRGYRPHRRGT